MIQCLRCSGMGEICDTCLHSEIECNCVELTSETLRAFVVCPGGGVCGEIEERDGNQRDRKRN